MVLVEENLSTAVFITVAGDALNWTVQIVKFSVEINYDVKHTCRMERGQVVIVSDTEAAENRQNPAKVTAKFTK
jgi:hypothetical protein